MMNMKTIVSLFVAASVSFGLVRFADAEDAKKGKPTKILYITGGGYHDYKNQVKILSEGIGKRTKIEWTTFSHVKDFSGLKENWADAYDVVIHNQCWAAFKDVSKIDDFVKKQKDAGVGVVVIHCAMHTFRSTKTKEWDKLVGVESTRHGAHFPIHVKTLKSDHPIMKGFEGFFQEGRPVDGVPAFNSLHRAFWQITGHYYPEEMLANFLMEAIAKAIPAREFDDFDSHIAKMRSLGTKIYGETLREAISTADFTTAFGDALNKRLQAEYRDDPLSDWREIVSRRENLRDLTNNHRIVRIGGYGTLPIVAQKAPYQELSEPTEAVEQLVPKKRGGLAILTWEDMLADSIGVVASIPRRLGRAANRTVHEIVWDEIENNPVLDADSVALIASAHNNRLSGDGAISGDNVATLIEALIDQTEQDSGRKLGLTAWRILTGPTLFQEAWEIANSDVKDTTNQDATRANFIKGLGVTAMKTIGIGRTSATKNRWYVVASPRDAECIVVGFLGGRDRPEIFVQSPTATPTVGASFDADLLTFKIRFGVAAKVVDFRWIQGSLTA